MNDAPPAANPPAMSVVLVASDSFMRIRRVVAHLARQTVADQLELILCAPKLEDLADATDADLAPFHGVKRVAVGPITDVDLAFGAGALHATAPLVAITEDHAYPEPPWAAALIDAHRAGYGLAGSSMLNPNPGPLSWGNLIVGYGFVTPPIHGEVGQLAGHNLSFKRELIEPYGDDLPRRMQRGGGLLDDLKKRGARFFLPEDARLWHVNPSSLRATFMLRMNTGRLYAWLRARDEGWSIAKRLVYVLLWPLIPVVRYRRLWGEMFGGGKRPDAKRHARFGLALALVFDGLGQMLGFLLGPGRSETILATFEMDRHQHLTRADRQRFGDWWHNQPPPAAPPQHAQPAPGATP